MARCWWRRGSRPFRTSWTTPTRPSLVGYAPLRHRFACCILVPYFMVAQRRRCHQLAVWATLEAPVLALSSMVGMQRVRATPAFPLCMHITRGASCKHVAFAQGPAMPCKISCMFCQQQLYRIWRRCQTPLDNKCRVCAEEGTHLDKKSGHQI